MASVPVQSTGAFAGGSPNSFAVSAGAYGVDLTGSVSVSALPSATFGFFAIRAIDGSVSVIPSISSGLVFSNVSVISGNVSIPVGVSSGLTKINIFDGGASVSASVTGDLLRVLKLTTVDVPATGAFAGYTPNSFAVNAGAYGVSIKGYAAVQVAPNAGLQYLNVIIFNGNVAVSSVVSSDMLFSGVGGLIGSISVSAQPSSVFNRAVISSGDITVSFLPISTLAYRNSTRTFDGDVTVNTVITSQMLSDRYAGIDPNYPIKLGGIDETIDSNSGGIDPTIDNNSGSIGATI